MSEKLQRFAEMIHSGNSRINLTGYRTVQDIYELLIDESILAAETLRLHSEMVLDFGSGAGIPGLVWSCYLPELQVYSMEIRQKKAAFQKEVVRELALSAKVITGRFPEDAPKIPFNIIVSRAVRFDPVYWDAAKDLFAAGGKFVRFAGRDSIEQGWTSIPMSSRTNLLIREATQS